MEKQNLAKELLRGSYCDGCRNTCELTRPRCVTGARQARHWLDVRKAELARQAEGKAKDAPGDSAAGYADDHGKDNGSYWDQFVL